ncbi:IclR family transcriptional regulator [Peptococcaceae bacterium 1198_IL3148]
MDNALLILDLLSKHEELGASEVARLMGMGKSTAFRLLSTLEGRRFVSKTENNKYRLGIHLVSIGSLVIHRMEIVRVVHPYLLNLSQQCNETAHLVVWNDDTRVQFIDKVQSSSSSIRMESMVGMCRRAHLTGTGKVLLAYQNEGAIEHYIKVVDFSPKTAHSITNGEQLLQSLEEIRRQGYGCDEDESEIGLTCFAAPIMDLSGHALAAISVSGPGERMNARRQELINLVKIAAAEISQSLQ